MGRIITNAQISTIIAKYDDKTPLEKITSKVKEWLNGKISGYEINIQIPHQLIDGIDQQSRTFYWLLTSLGGISLLAGGIGIMNVMVMNISERRREIGIRMSLGARPKDITLLFLIEAIYLSFAGSIAGVCSGMILSYVFIYLSGWNAFVISPISIPLAIGSSISTGLFFGLYPAISASRLSPLKALRDE